MGRTVADTCLLMAAQAAWTTAIRCRIRSTPAAIAAGRPGDLGALRVAWTEDFGQCPVSKRDPQRVLREQSGGDAAPVPKSCDEVAFDFGEADRCFDVIRALNFVARYRDGLREGPEPRSAPTCAPTTRWAPRMSLADVAWAHAEQTRIFRRFQQTFRDYDLVLAPTTPVSPFPWTQLYLAEMDGKPLRNYYHWLALTYVITLVTNPAISHSLRRRPAGHAVRAAGGRAASAATARCSTPRTRWSRRSRRSRRCAARGRTSAS